MKRLSKNEKQALSLTAKGFKNREIAKMMKSKEGESMSEKTISTYLRRVRKKLNVPFDKNVCFLVAEASRQGVIEIDPVKKELLHALINVRKWYEENQKRYLGEVTPVCFSAALTVIQKATTDEERD